MKAAGGCLVIVLLVLLVSCLLPDHKSSSPSTTSESESAQTSVPEAKPDPRSNPEKQISVDLVGWQKGGFDMVMIVTLKIKNDNDFAVKDVVVNCETVGASGTKLSEQSETIFRTFPAHSKKLVRNMNFGFIHQQSARASCELVSATAL